MDAPSNSSEVATWVQAGGLLAFASAVYWELRQLRPFLKDISEALAVLRDRTGKRAPTAPTGE